MRWWTPAVAVGLIVCAGVGCDDDDPLAPSAIDPAGEYRVATTVVSNTCVVAFDCEPICNLWWLAISSEIQPLYVGQYGDDLVVCPTGQNQGSMIVSGSYADGLFDFETSNRIIISQPDPGCRMAQRWTSTLGFTSTGFGGDAVYELSLIDGDPEICAASSERYSSLPCETEFEFEAVRCTGCTPAACDDG